MSAVERSGRPTPVPGVLGALGWLTLGAVLTPILLPYVPAYRTAIVCAAVVLFAAALLMPRFSFVLAVVTVSGCGVSALLFGCSEPAMAGSIPLAGYLAGSSLADVYDIGLARTPLPLLAVWRAFAVASGVSAVSAMLSARTSYLLMRGVPPPRIVNVLREDASQSVVGILSAVAALAIAAGLHRAASRLSREPGGRRAIDAALVAGALVAGGVALLQRLDALPLWRAQRWLDWNRAQATLSDPSSAGVFVALLVAPLLACAATPGLAVLRIAAAAGAALLLAVLAETGSRAGLVGTLTATSLFVLWALTRLAAGVKPGVRRRVASTVGALAILSAFAFGAALSWPTRGAEHSVLLSRLEAPFRKLPSPAEKTSNRLLLYSGALAIFREHPVVGIGVGGFRSEFPNAAAELLLRPVVYTDNPPSFYLGTLVESGLAGVALLLLLLLGLVRGLSGALSFSEAEPEEALRAAGAAAAVTGLLVVFLFGSHLVYPEIAALLGILTARLPFPAQARTSRLLAALMPVVLAGTLVLLLGGILVRGYETATANSAFARDGSAGVYPVEHEPDGRAFRWTSGTAAWKVGGAGVSSVSSATVLLPVKNARPDGKPVNVQVFYDDRALGLVSLPKGGWKRLSLPVDGPGVLRLVMSEEFRPLGGFDSRRLGIETGGEPILVPRRAP